MMSHELFICPVCGYNGLEEPAYTDGVASFVICPSCGTEFGYDDATTSHAVLRQKWIEYGMRWWLEQFSPPHGWNPVEQLKRAGLIQ